MLLPSRKELCHPQNFPGNPCPIKTWGFHCGEQGHEAELGSLLPGVPSPQQRVGMMLWRLLTGTSGLYLTAWGLWQALLSLSVPLPLYLQQGKGHHHPKAQNLTLP